MLKITPGPWTVSNRDTVVGDRGTVVAECVGYSERGHAKECAARGAREHNARLIACAPTLAAVLERMLDEYLTRDPIGGPVAALTLEQARDILDKARGRK